MNDLEKIVNTNADLRRFARARALARKRKRRLNMMLICICAQALIALSMVIFGSIGVVHNLLAVIISVLSVMAACFTLGAYMEKVKR